MKITKSPTEVLDELIAAVSLRGFEGDYEAAVRRAKRDGTPIPEKYRPGGIVLGLPAEDRAVLKGLTSEMTRRYRV